MAAPLGQFVVMSFPRRLRFRYLRWRYKRVEDIPARQLNSVLGFDSQAKKLCSAVREIAERFEVKPRRNQTARLLDMYLNNEIQDAMVYQGMRQLSNSPTPRRAVFDLMVQVRDVYPEQVIKMFKDNPEQRVEFETWLDS